MGGGKQMESPALHKEKSCEDSGKLRRQKVNGLVMKLSSLIMHDEHHSVEMLSDTHPHTQEGERERGLRTQVCAQAGSEAQKHSRCRLRFTSHGLRSWEGEEHSAMLLLLLANEESKAKL